MDTASGSIAFNGERGKLSEAEYRKAFETNDEQYSAMLRALVEAGGRVTQVTLLFNAATGQVRPMRSKEESHDYRYFPDPDLPPLAIEPAWVERVRAAEQERVGGTKLAEAVARYYAKLLAYKDEYEVARLYTDGAFRNYETDYWLTCYKEAVEKLNEITHGQVNLFVKREAYVAAPYADVNIAVTDLRNAVTPPRSGDYVLVNTPRRTAIEIFTQCIEAGVGGVAAETAFRLKLTIAGHSHHVDHRRSASLRASAETYALSTTTLTTESRSRISRNSSSPSAPPRLVRRRSKIAAS